MTGRRYPLPTVGEDRRFTAGLLFDVVCLLERHGYPRPVGAADLVHWQQALFRAIYRNDQRASTLT
jgi:hypothetical protein